jgi:hypothetical protein
MNEFSELKVIASKIPKGTTDNQILCPWCRGGEHGDKAFSVTIREDGVGLFMCHRVSCRKHGRIYLNGQIGLSVAQDARSQRKLNPYEGSSRLLNDDELKTLEAVYGFNRGDVKRGRLFCDVSSSRLGITICGPTGNIRGVELRLFKSAIGKRKTWSHPEVDEPWLGWFSGPNSQEPVVLVEDVLSALKVSRQFVAVSLMGSHLKLDDLMEVCRYTDQVVLCLDRDATSKAIDFKKRFMFICPQLRVVPLPGPDLKYLPDRDIRSLVLGTEM